MAAYDMGARREPTCFLEPVPPRSLAVAGAPRRCNPLGRRRPKWRRLRREPLRRGCQALWCEMQQPNSLQEHGRAEACRLAAWPSPRRRNPFGTQQIHRPLAS